MLPGMGRSPGYLNAKTPWYSCGGWEFWTHPCPPLTSAWLETWCFLSPLTQSLPTPRSRSEQPHYGREVGNITFLSFVGGWEWGYVFSLVVKHPFPISFYFARLFFFSGLRRGGGREGVGEGGFPLCFVSLFCLMVASSMNPNSRKRRQEEKPRNLPLSCSSDF